MSELQHYKSFILTYNATTGTFAVGTGGRVYVFSEGASVNQAGTLSGSAGTVLTVFDAGSFAINDYCQIGMNGVARLVTAVGATTITLGAGSAQTVAVGDRALNIGTASDKTISHATVYAVDQSSSTAITQPVLADANGNFEFFADTGDYDILMQNSTGTDIAIDTDITLFAIGRTSTVTYIQNVNDDFSVGAASLGTNTPFYVDTSSLITYFGGSTKSNVIIDGFTGSVTVGSGSTNPTVVFDNNTNFTTTLISSTTTSNKTITLPNLTGTVLVSSTGATQTIVGNQVFSGGATFNATFTVAGGSTLTGLITGSTGAEISGGTTDVERLASTLGSVVTSSAVVLSSSPSWGTSPSVTMDPAAVFTSASASTDPRMSFTVSVGTGSPGANPTITITFVDGTWTTAPHVMVVRNGGSASLTGLISWTVTPTAIVITYNGTPAASASLPLTVYSWG